MNASKESFQTEKKEVVPEIVSIGDYECSFTLSQGTITARILSTTDSLGFSWQLTTQEFNKNQTLSSLHGYIASFMEFVKKYSQINQSGFLVVKYLISIGSYFQKDKSLYFQLKKFQLSNPQDFNIISTKLRKNNSQLNDKLTKIQQMLLFSLPNAQKQNMKMLSFIPNTMEQSIRDFFITKKDTKFRVRKTKKPSEYSRLANNISINTQKNGKFYYHFVVSNQWFDSIDSMYIGFGAKNKNNYYAFSLLYQIHQYYFLVVLSLSNMKTKSFINETITPVPKASNDLSMKPIISSQNLEIQMQIDVESGVIAWFVNGFFVDCSRIDLCMSSQWVACVYCYNVNSTVIVDF